jgi:hypothetical protein
MTNQQIWLECIDALEKYLKYYTSASAGSLHYFAHGNIEAYKQSIEVVKEYMGKSNNEVESLKTRLKLAEEKIEVLSGRFGSNLEGTY